MDTANLPYSRRSCSDTAILSPAYIAPLSKLLSFFHFQLIIIRSPRAGLSVYLCPAPYFLLTPLFLMPNRAILLLHLQDRLAHQQGRSPCPPPRAVENTLYTSPPLCSFFVEASPPILSFCCCIYTTDMPTNRAGHHAPLPVLLRTLYIPLPPSLLLSLEQYRQICQTWGKTADGVPPSKSSASAPIYSLCASSEWRYIIPSWSFGIPTGFGRYIMTVGDR